MFYELSRRRELGLDTSWKHAFDVFHSPSIRAIAALGLLLLAIFAVWLAVANAIYEANFGQEPMPLGAFVRRVLTTPEGQNLIIVGNVVGFLFALLAFSLSVVSFPLLLDRNVGVAVAITTSVKTILKNPVMMALWGIFVAGLLLIGSLPFLIGLAVVLPVLGHSHLALVSQGRRTGSAPPARDSIPDPKDTATPQISRFPCSSHLTGTRRHSAKFCTITASDFAQFARRTLQSSVKRSRRTFVEAREMPIQSSRTCHAPFSTQRVRARAEPS